MFITVSLHETKKGIKYPSDEKNAVLTHKIVKIVYYHIKEV